MNDNSAPAAIERAPVVNFGGNLRFHPASRHAPRSEAEVLELLRIHRGRRIRAAGRLHSWSEAPVAEEVLLDLRNLQTVKVQVESSGDAWAEVGAGCQIKRLLAELQRQGGYTMPSLGLITEQSIAGAAATGTHGSGRHSISHYLRWVRLAVYDAAGEPTIRTVDAGEDLRAARCGLGTLGIVTAVGISIRPQYHIEEHFRRYDDLPSVLSAESPYDLQQFFLAPWRWDYFAQHRREVDVPRSRLAPLYRCYWRLGMDLGLHLVMRQLARRLPASCTRGFYRRLMPALVPRGWKVIDRSDRQLTMRHELFQHIEIEMFVGRSRLAAALECIVWLLRTFGGETCDPPAQAAALQTFPGDDWEAIQQARGQYVHHYPICIRKILPDDTLISMAAGDEPWYAISFISYAHPRRREGFLRCARLLARTTSALYGARPHWGKVQPLDAEMLRRLYPEWDAFCEVVRRFDPQGTFGNAWTDKCLFGDANSIGAKNVGPAPSGYQSPTAPSA